VRVLASVIASLLISRTHEDCSCPPAPPLRVEMSSTSVAALRAITFEPTDCGRVASPPTPCTSSPCAALIYARVAGNCTVALAFEGGRIERVSTTWVRVGDDDCCGDLVPRDSTLVVRDP